jgi:hypothetical protein
MYLFWFGQPPRLLDGMERIQFFFFKFTAEKYSYYFQNLSGRDGAAI